MENKKILIFIPTLKSGGAERVVSILANEWINYTEEVIVCLLDAQNISFQVDPKVKIIEIPKLKIKFLPQKLKYIYELRKIIKQLKPDIIQSFLTEYNLLLIIANLGLKRNIYVSDRANPLVYRGYFIEILRKLFYGLAKGIVVQTLLAQNVTLKKIKHSNIIVIPNPVDIPNEISEQSIEKNILNVGRLIPEKGQKDLVKVFYKSKLFVDGWKLIIVGDGPLKDNLEQLIKKLKLEQSIELVGQKKNVGPYFRKSSIFAFTSYTEGFPNALLEAMAYGLPAISYNCNAGPNDLIENNKNGILIPVRDKKLFIKNLIQLANDAELRKNLSRKARETSLNYSTKIIAKKWHDFITS